MLILIDEHKAMKAWGYALSLINTNDLHMLDIKFLARFLTY